MLSETKLLSDGYVWVKGYEGLYLVNVYGVLVSIKRKFTKPNSIKKAYLRKSAKTYKYKPSKYYVHTLSKHGKYSDKAVHRLIAEAFIPNPENKPEVNHIDGNTLNNDISNLEWVTKSEQQFHAHRIGLNKITDAGRKKLSEVGKMRRSLDEDGVKKVKELKKKGLTMTQIGRSMKIPIYTVSRIIKGSTYKEYEEEL